MRVLLVLILPFLLQVIAYLVVFAASRGGGSFMGLLAMPVAAVTVVVLLIHGLGAAKRSGALLSPALASLAIALLPPLGLLILRALGV